MNEDQVKALLTYITVGMQILSARIMLLLAISMAFSLFCWAMYIPDTNRIVIATLFGVLVFIPILTLDKKEKQNERPES